MYVSRKGKYYKISGSARVEVSHEEFIRETTGENYGKLRTREESPKQEAEEKELLSNGSSEEVPAHFEEEEPEEDPSKQEAVLETESSREEEI